MKYWVIFAIMSLGTSISAQEKEEKEELVVEFYDNNLARVVDFKVNAIPKIPLTAQKFLGGYRIFTGLLPAWIDTLAFLIELNDNINLILSFNYRSPSGKEIETENDQLIEIKNSKLTASQNIQIPNLGSTLELFRQGNRLYQLAKQLGLSSICLEILAEKIVKKLPAGTQAITGNIPAHDPMYDSLVAKYYWLSHELELKINGVSAPFALSLEEFDEHVKKRDWLIHLNEKKYLIDLEALHLIDINVLPELVIKYLPLDAKVTEIILADNYLVGSALHVIEKFKEITLLILSDNPLEELPLGTLTNCLHLQELRLSNTILKSIQPEHVIKNTQLHILDLNGNQLKKFAKELLKDKPAFTMLNISGNQFETFDHDMLQYAQSLISLDISNNIHLKSIPESFLYPCPMLKELFLTGCKNISSLPEKFLANSKELEVIELNETGIKTLPITFFNACENSIELIQLPDNFSPEIIKQFSKKIQDAIANAKKLRKGKKRKSPEPSEHPIIEEPKTKIQKRES